VGTPNGTSFAWGQGRISDSRVGQWFLPLWTFNHLFLLNAIGTVHPAREGPKGQQYLPGRIERRHGNRSFGSHTWQGAVKAYRPHRLNSTFGTSSADSSLFVDLNMK
jgi:hypothetical protein